jgi:EmrB/QacA subfamily drug resistance transporter
LTRSAGLLDDASDPDAAAGAGKSGSAAGPEVSGSEVSGSGVSGSGVSGSGVSGSGVSGSALDAAPRRPARAGTTAPRSRTGAGSSAGSRSPSGATTAPASGAPPGPGPTDKWGLPLAALIIGMFMSVLDTSIVNVAIPTMQKDFGASSDDIAWVATAYTLCMGVVVPATAWLGDRIGLKRIYLVSLLAFSVASALCGVAWNLDVMIIFRILQAIPGGIIPVVCMTTLYRIVPPPKIGSAMGMYGLGVVVAPAVGPALGGYLVQYVDWRLIFYINVPIGVLGTLLAMAVLPTFPTVGGRKFDTPGFLCIAGGLFALLLAVSEGSDWGWTGYRVLMLMVAGVLLLALFVVIELEVAQPLLDVRILRYWPYVNSLLLISVLMVGMFAVLYFVPLFLQEGRGLEALPAGLLVMPQACVMLVMMPIAGRLYDKIGPRWLAVSGLVINAYGTYLLCGISADLTNSDIVVWTMIRSLGVGLSMMPIMTAGVAALPPHLISFGSAINNLAQRGFAAFGVAALTAFTVANQAQLMADRNGLVKAINAGSDPRILQLSGQGPMGLYPLLLKTQAQVQAQTYSNAFLVCTVLTVIGLVLAFFLRSGVAGSGAGKAEAVEL